MKKFIMILAAIAGLSAFEVQGSWMRFAASKAWQASSFAASKAWEYSSSTAGQIAIGSFPLTAAVTSLSTFPERTITSLASTPIGKFITPETSKTWWSWGLDGCTGFASDVTKQILTMLTISAVMGMVKSMGSSSQDDEMQQRPQSGRILTAQELAARRA